MFYVTATATITAPSIEYFIKLHLYIFIDTLFTYFPFNVKYLRGFILLHITDTLLLHLILELTMDLMLKRYAISLLLLYCKISYIHHSVDVECGKMKKIIFQ